MSMINFVRICQEVLMLSGYNDEMLINSGVSEEVVPFYQRWQELMNRKTLDIYQYKIMTSLTAMKEMVEVIKKTQAGLFTTDANIKACRGELLFILNQDKVLMKHMIFIQRHIWLLWMSPSN